MTDSWLGELLELNSTDTDEIDPYHDQAITSIYDIVLLKITLDGALKCKLMLDTISRIFSVMKMFDI